MELKEYLKSRNLSIEEFSEITNLHRNTIYCCIRQKTEPKLTTALKIADATKGKVTMRELAKPWETQ
jgi:DNA-binding XRE family transcriptional regulator